MTDTNERATRQRRRTLMRKIAFFLSFALFCVAPRLWDPLDILFWHIRYSLPFLARPSLARDTHVSTARLMRAGLLTVDEAFAINEAIDEWQEKR